MKSIASNRTKILFLGVAVALVSLLSSTGGVELAEFEKQVVETGMESKNEALKVRAKLQLEKLATSKKLAKEIDQKFTAEGNTMVN